MAAFVSSNTKVVEIENFSFPLMPSLIRSKKQANTKVEFLRLFFRKWKNIYFQTMVASITFPNFLKTLADSWE